MDMLRKEYVLVQAWKKTVPYIRYHNWFSDALELDRSAVNLPKFLGDIYERLQSSDHWKNDPLRIVPAPKSQKWTIQDEKWLPIDKGKKLGTRLRPLAHVSLADQVLGTALMLCLADRVETLQGDPRHKISDLNSCKQVISYGNRLYCDNKGEKLFHRWGSSKLFRAYYVDYRSFLYRPEKVVQLISTTNEDRFCIVHADLRQFYDRVSPSLLAQSLNQIKSNDDDPAFYSFAESVLNWGWHAGDTREVSTYAKNIGLDNFSRVALPQGLVASGFFSNLVLLSFDAELRSAIGTEVTTGIKLIDACRYVDDMRILISLHPSFDVNLSDPKIVVSNWINQILKATAPGLELSPNKTKIVMIGNDERPIIRQRAKMNRIRMAISGGFDSIGGVEILDAIQGLMRTQGRLNADYKNEWRLTPTPDVSDETVARFGATRYRSTFRSIRPLLGNNTHEVDHDEVGVEATYRQINLKRTQHELDNNARVFALSLIKQWIEDPSNVRLLRIGLDLWPDASLLREVLSLLKPFTVKGKHRGPRRRVALYCLSEILRAGSTETGLVEDFESLPSGINIQSYRKVLTEEAIRLVKLPKRQLPWYLRQQALLFLAVYNPTEAPVMDVGSGIYSRHYRELIHFLRSDGAELKNADIATLAILARRSFVDHKRAVKLTQPLLNTTIKRDIAKLDPSFFIELNNSDTNPHFIDDLPTRIKEDLCLYYYNHPEDGDTLANIVLNNCSNNPLRNELSLLRYANKFLKQWEKMENPPRAITPGQIKLKLNNDQVADIKELEILRSQLNSTGSMFEVPTWCKPGEEWRLQLGFLLRFILSQHPDFTRHVRLASWKETATIYRRAESHWYQRLYGLFSGQPAFGDNWAPITEWTEEFLLALLRWPGCHSTVGFDWIGNSINKVRKKIHKRIDDLENMRGNATSTLILPISPKPPEEINGNRSLRACVVQTVIPADEDFGPADLTMNESKIRRRHRNHLSAALAAVKRMLALRETHKDSDGRLDWLILPELAVHPSDINTHLVPFARAHQTMILAGLTYEEVLTNQPYINSALWVIPEWSSRYGLQIRTRRQGKQHLAPNERKYNDGNKNVLRGFRPCQWLIGYPWSDINSNRPVWLTASVCYDATDLGLVSDLKSESDILAIPALNKDIKTFDQMALALHYHMFQLVLVVNNGKYGGSSAYWPMKKDHKRRIFHTHGQPQASIEFLEIDNIGHFLQRRDVSKNNTKVWKYPPAGL